MYSSSFNMKSQLKAINPDLLRIVQSLVSSGINEYRD